ncbi:MAG: DUF1566 domain-containing protein [Crocinitomicaceae bacterium]|jgi:hypothetical protein
MKQVLFILLLFISFQGFSQESVKLKRIGLEVMKKDLGKMNWEEAKKACENLGDGWRLPTIDEFRKIYKYKDKIGGFARKYCWSSTETDDGNARFFGFSDGSAYATIKDEANYVRAVRSLK